MAVDIHKSWMEHCSQRRQGASAAGAPDQLPDQQLVANSTRGAESEPRGGKDDAQELAVIHSSPSGLSETTVAANTGTNPVGSPGVEGGGGDGAVCLDDTAVSTQFFHIGDDGPPWDTPNGLEEKGPSVDLTRTTNV